jgi:hypothetical protein
MTGGLLYGRILAFDGALVEYEQIYRRGRLGAPRGTLATADRGFIEGTFGGWYVGS